MNNAYLHFHVMFSGGDLLPLHTLPLSCAQSSLRFAVQTHYNTLMDKISQDADFLEEALAGYKGNVGGMLVLVI